MTLPPNTITRELEVQDFRSPLGRIQFDLSRNGDVSTFTFDILRCQYVIHHETRQFIHPAPPFCRLFLFFKAGGRIVMDGWQTEFVPGILYLLGDEHPFQTTYDQGSELLYLHVCATDHTLRSIFTGGQGLRTLDYPEMTTLLASAYRNGGALEIQSAVTAVLGRFAAAEMPQLQERHLLSRHFLPIFEAAGKTPPAQLRVEELAATMRMTPSALSKSFRRRTGMTLKEYLTRLYLKRAGELLLYSDASTKEIATTLGHPDPHYFYDTFKRLAGCTPTAYRTRHRGYASWG